jgi:hypothetical protein
MRQPAGIHTQNHVGYSTSGTVALYPNTNTIIKFPHSAEGEDDIFGTWTYYQREKEVYERLIALGRPATILKSTDVDISTFSRRKGNLYSLFVQ